jgi:undecaprenyl-diphosphatase
MDQPGTQSGPALPPERPLLRRVPLAWLIPGIALGLFLLLATVVYGASQPCFGWDLDVAHTVQATTWPGFDGLMRGVCQADNDAPRASLLIAAACIVLALRRAWREMAVLVGVVGVGLVLWVVSGRLVGRPRPTPDLIHVLIDAKDVEGFPSFPSGHAVHYTVFFGFLWFLTFTRVKPAALRWPLLGLLGGLVLLVGLGRVYLGAHWCSDVIGGYLLGAAVLATGIGVHRRWGRGATGMAKSEDGVFGRSGPPPEVSEAHNSPREASDANAAGSHLSP